MDVHLEQPVDVRQVVRDFYGEKSQKFGRFARMYAFTTEDIAGYFGKLPFADASVLTVCGSGDHVINAYLFGAKSVTAFDVNVFSAFITELKLAALRTFDYETFKGFLLREAGFHEPNPHALDIPMYLRLRPQLSARCADFFDAAYAKYGPGLRESSFFNNKFDTNGLKISSNPYLQSAESYAAAQQRTKEKTPCWIECDVADIARRVDGRHNVILLSNIADYVDLDRFAEVVVAPLGARLDGTMCAAYVYGAGMAVRSAVDDPARRKETFTLPGLRYEEFEFKSVIEGHNDLVALLTTV